VLTGPTVIPVVALRPDFDLVPMLVPCFWFLGGKTKSNIHLVSRDNCESPNIKTHCKMT